jgi:hypothetical protein
MRIFIGIVGLSCVVAFNIAPASGQCITIPSPALIERAKSIDGALIFSGVVTEETRLSFGSAIAFDVDGIWKGSLPKKAVLFRLAFSESRIFVVNEHYVVFANPAAASVRQRFQEAGVDPSAVFDLGSACDTATYAEAEKRGYFPALGPPFRQPY